MKKIFDNITFECESECSVKHYARKNNFGAVIHTFSIGRNHSRIEENTKIKLFIKKDAVRHMYYWNPDCGLERSMPLGWVPGKNSMTSISAPVSCVYDGNGQNQFTCALSEVKEVVELKTAIVNDKYFGMEASS